MTFGQVLIAAGALFVLMALFADLLGLARHPNFGWMQGLGVIIGAVVILAGVYLWSHGKAPP